MKSSKQDHPAETQILQHSFQMNVGPSIFNQNIPDFKTFTIEGANTYQKKLAKKLKQIAQSNS